MCDRRSNRRLLRPRPLLGLPIVGLTVMAPAALGQVAPGHRIYGPHGTSETYMVDANGAIVHAWPSSYPPGNGLYLDAEGVLVRTGMVSGGPTIGGTGGAVQRIGIDGTISWDFQLADGQVWGHHDIALMPNGHVLMIAWDRMTAADAIAAGRDPSILSGSAWMPDAIYELRQSGPTTADIVWEWHVRDHLVQDHDATKANFGVVADHPELLDVNFPPTNVGNGDWNHANSIDYDAESDLIVLNFPFQDEFYVLDHSTTTAEAAGHTGGTHGKGGDFLYRWGNPAAYDAGTGADQQLFNQHGTSFIDDGLPGAGNILLFNNQYGSQFGQDFSALFELVLPNDFDLAPGASYGPAGPVWQYTAPTPTDFYSSGLSNAERLPNGNTLVDSGRQNGWLFELDPQEQIVWEYFNTLPTPNALVFQVSYDERTLWATDASPSLATGGAVALDLIAGTQQAGQLYLVLGSASGTTPGIPAGPATLPLNFDAYLELTLTQANSALFPASFGVLDAVGKAQSGFVLPAGLNPGLAGANLHHAFVALDPVNAAVTHVSNAVTVELAP